MKRLIGIHGKISSGKDAVGRLIRKQAPDWKIKKYATKIKRVVSEITGIPVRSMENRVVKDTPLGPEWVRYCLYIEHRYIPDKIFLTESEAEKYAFEKLFGSDGHLIAPNDFRIEREELTIRTLMQLLGTECGREIIHPNFWVNALFSDYTEDSQWIITDVRFPNEAEAIKEKGGLLVHVDRPFELRHPRLCAEFFRHSKGMKLKAFLQKHHLEKYKELYHVSEISLDEYTDWDIHIKNNHNNLQELEQHVRSHQRLVSPS